MFIKFNLLIFLFILVGCASETRVFKKKKIGFYLDDPFNYQSLYKRLNKRTFSLEPKESCFLDAQSNDKIMTFTTLNGTENNTIFIYAYLNSPYVDIGKIDSKVKYEENKGVYVKAKDYFLVTFETAWCNKGLSSFYSYRILSSKTANINNVKDIEKLYRED